MNFNAKNNWSQYYINNMRPVFNKRALFADTTGEYVIPPEPAAYSILKLRFRTFKNNVDRVFLCLKNERLLMDKEESIGEFDYYGIEITLDDEEIRYCFEVVCGRITCFYDTRGAVGSKGEEFYFHVIPGFKIPDWAKGAVMYQIFVDRFYNGDPGNDVLDHEYNYIGDHTVRVTDWNKYPAAMGIREFYGGDLQGVMDKLDYLEDLGIQVIYFNPLFVSPSNHKYDIQDYDYIDPHFGVIVEDEGRLLEDWEKENSGASRYINRVTNLKNLEASNALFAKLVEECHKRGIKVIIDGVFNHCGSFNKWLDRERIYEGQPGYAPGAYVSEDSPYHSFFKFHGGSFPYNETYDGWWGHDTLPKLNYEDSQKLQDYIFEIAAKWVSPPYNVDGWRLDVAADLGFSVEFNHNFWKKFRRVVKEANPNAVIIAEHYGCARDWLKGDEWDSVMNYDAFMEPLTWFLTGMQKHSDDYRGDMLGNADNFWGAMKYHSSFFARSSLQMAMNELSNHDHSRFLTRTNHIVGRMNNMGCEAANRDVNKAVMRNAVLMQFTWTGAPTIYYGDEAGVCGFTDPDNRRTYPWGNEDHELIRFHKEMIRIHKMCPEILYGSTKYLMGDNGMTAYGRFDDIHHTVVVVNNTEREASVNLSAWLVGVPRECYMDRLMLSTENSFDEHVTPTVITGGHLVVTMPPYSSAVYRHVDEEPND